MNGLRLRAGGLVESFVQPLVDVPPPRSGLRGSRIHQGRKVYRSPLFAYNFRAHAPMPGDATLFVILLIVGIFAADIIRRWWRETEWKRRWRRDRDDDK